MKEIILAAQIAGISATPFLQFWRDIDVFSAQLSNNLAASQAISFNDRIDRVKELAFSFYKSGGECDSELTFPTFDEVDSTPYDTRLSEASNLKQLASDLNDWISSFVCLEGNNVDDKKNLHVLGRIVGNMVTLARKFDGEDAQEFFYYEVSEKTMTREEAANYCYGMDMWLAEPGMDAARKQMLIDALPVYPDDAEYWFDGTYNDCSTIDLTGAEGEGVCDTKLQAVCEAGERSETTSTTTSTTTAEPPVPPEDCVVYMRGESHLTYDDARDLCADSGMYLYFSKNSDQFDNFISEEIRRVEWYGLKRKDRYSSSWVTSDGGNEGPTYGNDYYYTRWKAGEPNNSGWNEGCAMINMGDGIMNDIPCDRKFAYTCAKMIAVGDEHTNDEERCMCTATGLVCEPKYTCTYFERNKGEKASFEEAKQQCEDNAATLAFFKTEEEFEQFLDDMDRDSDDDVSGRRGEEVQWIGIERTGNGVNDWQTVDNSTDFFAQWKDGEPDNADMNEYCAEIDLKDEEMSDVNCDRKERKFSCRQELIPGEIVVKDREICECTEDGVECERLTYCPEFVRMDNAATYDDAKAECAEMNGHVAFFEDEDEFDKFMDDENFKRKEWLGIEYVGPYNSVNNWRTSDGGEDYYKNWNFGEPNGGSQEPCAEINMNDDGKYNDIPCDTMREFSCRIIKITRGRCD